MKLISSRLSFGYKLFPYIFTSILGFIVIMLLKYGAFRQAPWLLVVPIFIGLVGYSGNKEMSELADAVYDCGDYLLVRKNGREETVLFSNIVEVGFSVHRNGAAPRITLRLVTPGAFGPEIVFAPPPRFFFGGRGPNETADDLSARVAKTGPEMTP
jgi:hypothetical protein